MIYSKECEYAIRALAYLAKNEKERCMAKDIAEKADLPLSFISKILQMLVREKIVTSQKGPNGGFMLAKSAKSVTLYHIKALIDGVEDLDECAVGIQLCSDESSCPLHEDFKPVRKMIKAYLKQTNLADMAQALNRKTKLRT